MLNSHASSMRWYKTYVRLYQAKRNMKICIPRSSVSIRQLRGENLADSTSQVGRHKLLTTHMAPAGLSDQLSLLPGSTCTLIGLFAYSSTSAQQSQEFPAQASPTSLHTKDTASPTLYGDGIEKGVCNRTG